MIAIGSDHGGFELKELLRLRLQQAGWEALDCGCYNHDQVDYPDVAENVASEILSGKCEIGILICGTGIGVSIAANKIDGIRAALCADTYSARMAKEHNNANIITLGARTLGVELAWEVVKTYLGASFAGGIHQVRVNKINAL